MDLVKLKERIPLEVTQLALWYNSLWTPPAGPKVAARLHATGANEDRRFT
jgi:hypothetical protein